MKVWEMIMVKREKDVEVEVRDHESLVVLYDSSTGKPLSREVIERDIHHIDVWSEETFDGVNTGWLCIYV